MRAIKPDKTFIGLVVATVVYGLFIYISATLSFLSKDPGQFYSMLFNQLVLGLLGGGIAAYLISKLDYRVWKKYALWIFIISILVMLLVFIPGLGFTHGGATSWLNLGPLSFQPAELLKLGYVIYLAAWLSWIKNKISSVWWGLLPFGAMTGIAGVLLLLQPDTGTFLVILASGTVMFFASGAKWRDILIMALVAMVGLGGLILMRPYVLERIKTFADPTHDPLGSSYQVQQSLIAVGSGKIAGRGYGQSVQKFNYLPEPAGDSIYAVLGEELGFIGTVVLLILVIAFLLRGYRIAYQARSMFGCYLVVGFTTIITVQSLLNMGGSLAVFPMTGLPLIFVSHGGTALLFALIEVGIIVNVSRYRKL